MFESYDNTQMPNRIKNLRYIEAEYWRSSMEVEPFHFRWVNSSTVPKATQMFQRSYGDWSGPGTILLEVEEMVDRCRSGEKVITKLIEERMDVVVERSG